MIKKKSNNIFKRIIINSILAEMVGFVIILVFTNSIFYCIITLLAFGIAVLGFITMIKAFDNFIVKKKYGFLLVLGLAKLTLVVMVFYFLAKHSEIAVISFAIGLSMIVAGILMEGVYQMYLGLFNGRT